MNIMLRILFATCFIIALSQVSWNAAISNLQIPMTGQTFAVLLVAYLMPIRESFLAVLLYIVLGLVGLPVFAEGGSGWKTIIGNSGGFILGFAFGALMTSSWAAWHKNTWINALIAMIFGTAIIMVFGISRLSFSFGWEKAIAYGFYPFWPGALVKIIVGGVLGKVLKDKVQIFYN